MTTAEPPRPGAGLARVALISGAASGIGRACAAVMRGHGWRTAGIDLHYVAAQGAVLGLVKSLAMEVAETGIRVNAVAPGRLVRPEEVASAVYYMATDGSMFCGEVLSPNAGAVI